MSIRPAASPAAPRRRVHRTAAGAWPVAAVCLGALWLLLQVVRGYGAAYVARRVLVLIATLVVATCVVFVIVQVVPGDPVRYMMGLQADPDAVLAMRHELSLDLPPLQRYGQWITGCCTGDFGVSYTYRVPVGALMAERLQVSLPLALLALLLSSALAFPWSLDRGGSPRRRSTRRSGVSRKWGWRCRILAGHVAGLAVCGEPALGIGGRISRLGRTRSGRRSSPCCCRQSHWLCRRPRSWRGCCRGEP